MEGADVIEAIKRETPQAGIIVLRKYSGDTRARRLCKRALGPTR
jgi:hypothetical protein